MPGHNLHLKEHGIVLPEQSKSIGEIIRCNIKLDEIIAMDDQFIRGQDKSMILHGNLKCFVRGKIPSVKINRCPWNGVVGNDVQ